MTKLCHGVEPKLEIPAFSQENLLNLINSNEGILAKELDTSSKISIKIQANLDWNVRVDNSTRFSVPAYYLPIERYELNEEANKILEQVLNIQKLASGDDPYYSHYHYGHGIFRKLATAIVRLEELKKLPEIETANSFKTKDFYTVSNFIDKLLENGKKKMANVEIQWEYKEWRNLGNDFQRYDSRKLTDLVGGIELYNQAITEAVTSFDVFDYIKEYNEKQEQRLLEYKPQPEKWESNKPIVLSLSVNGGREPAASDWMALSLYNDDDEAFELVKIRRMKEFVWLMDDWKEKDWLKEVQYIVINSAPPYFHGDSIEEFNLMMKYGIYNRGLCYPGLDYNGGCVDDIKGIIKLIKGEYPELPTPIALCDGSWVLADYNDDYIVMSLSDYSNRDKRIKEIKQLVLAKKN